MIIVGRGFTGCGNGPFDCHSERSEESLWPWMPGKRRDSSARSVARNDSALSYSASCLVATFKGRQSTASASEVWSLDLD
jgi:hypothetical protein